MFFEVGAILSDFIKSDGCLCVVGLLMCDEAGDCAEVFFDAVLDEVEGQEVLLLQVVVVAHIAIKINNVMM